jgi:cytochrome oxidase Cu insertion factor (SCO1/SenC/PrrC family)
VQLSVRSSVWPLNQTAQRPVLPDVQKLGPQVGSRVPDFTLLDQKGQSRTLASLRGPKGLMLVFYRSADWCPYCKTQLAELQTRTADLGKNGIGLAAVSYDAVSRRHRVQADRLIGRGAARSHHTPCAVSRVGGLPFQTS